MIYSNSTYFFDISKLDKLPRMKREYELYKHKFIKDGGLESDVKMLTCEEFKEVNEREE